MVYLVYLSRRDGFNYVLTGNVRLCLGTLPAMPPAAGFLDWIHGRRLMWGSAKLSSYGGYRYAFRHKFRSGECHEPLGRTLRWYFFEEAFNAFNSRHAYIRAAQDGLARATDKYVKDIRVREFNKYV